MNSLLTDEFLKHCFHINSVINYDDCTDLRKFVFQTIENRECYELSIPAREYYMIPNASHKLNRFSHYTVGLHKSHELRKYLIGFLTVDKNNGYFELKDNVTSFKCLIVNCYNVNIKPFGNNLVILLDYIMVTELIPNKWCTQYIIVDLDNMLKVPNTHKPADGLSHLIVPSDLSRAKYPHSLKDMFISHIFEPRISFQGSRIEKEWWIKTVNCRGEKMLICFDDKYFGTIPYLRENFSYDIYFTGSIVPYQNIEVSRIKEENTKVLSFKKDAVFIEKMEYFSTNDVYSVTEIWQLMQQNRAQKIVSFGGKLSRKVIRPYSSTSRSSIFRPVRGYGIPDSNGKQHVLYFGPLTLYLNNWESARLPLGLIAGMYIQVNNVIIQNNYLKCCAATSFCLMGYVETRTGTTVDLKSRPFIHPAGIMQSLPLSIHQLDNTLIMTRVACMKFKNIVVTHYNNGAVLNMCFYAQDMYGDALVVVNSLKLIRTLFSCSGFEHFEKLFLESGQNYDHAEFKSNKIINNNDAMNNDEDRVMKSFYVFFEQFASWMHTNVKLVCRKTLDFTSNRQPIFILEDIIDWKKHELPTNTLESSDEDSDLLLYRLQKYFVHLDCEDSPHVDNINMINLDASTDSSIDSDSEINDDDSNESENLSEIIGDDDDDDDENNDDDDSDSNMETEYDVCTDDSNESENIVENEDVPDSNMEYDYEIIIDRCIDDTDSDDEFGSEINSDESNDSKFLCSDHNDNSNSNEELEFDVIAVVPSESAILNQFQNDHTYSVASDSPTNVTELSESKNLSMSDNTGSPAYDQNQLHNKCEIKSEIQTSSANFGNSSKSDNPNSSQTDQYDIKDGIKSEIKSDDDEQTEECVNKLQTGSKHKLKSECLETAVKRCKRSDSDSEERPRNAIKTLPQIAKKECYMTLEKKSSGNESICMYLYWKHLNKLTKAVMKRCVKPDRVQRTCITI